MILFGAGDGSRALSVLNPHSTYGLPSALWFFSKLQFVQVNQSSVPGLSSQPPSHHRNSLQASAPAHRWGKSRAGIQGSHDVLSRQEMRKLWS